MSYFLYLCLFAYCGVQHILSCIFFCPRLVASFSGLSLRFTLTFCFIRI